MPPAASVDYTFAVARADDLVIEKTNIAGCDANGTAGDMTFRISPKP